MKRAAPQLPKATHEGELEIGEFKIKCYNLDTGERVLSREGLLRAIGRTGNPKYQENELFETPVFLRANNLKPFISNDLATSSKVIVFERAGGQKTYGYLASILPDVCYVFADALKAGVLTPKQERYAERAEILLRGFATVGIVALVDEATGYQYDRERDELQKILRAYIAEELLPWQKRFPDVFYKEIFRLNGWDYTVQDIKKRPSVIGKWTNLFIYEQLPKGVLKELKQKTPKSAAGHYLARFHQSLTEDIGNPHLQAQINSVIALMQVSDNWQQFVHNFNKMVDRRKGQLEIPYEKVEYKGEPKQVEETEFNKTLRALMKVPKPN